MTSKTFNGVSKIYLETSNRFETIFGSILFRRFQEVSRRLQKGVCGVSRAFLNVSKGFEESFSCILKRFQTSQKRYKEF